MNRVLVVEDDPAVGKGVAEALRQEHFTVFLAESGSRGRSLLAQENLDLIVLDLRLPDMRGEDLLAELRRSGNTVPVLILSSKKEEMDIVTLLEMGADDYMTKPFKIRILLAQVRALLRRRGEPTRDIEDYTFSDVHVDFKRHEAHRSGVPVRLSSREFEVLKLLVLHEGEVITRDRLLNEVWGYDQFPTTRTVDNYVLSLRKKLEQDPSAPRHIVTVHTSGYKFVRGDDEDTGLPDADGAEHKPAGGAKSGGDRAQDEPPRHAVRRRGSRRTPRR
jgi:DNA-binding response OmpR family regulator